MISKEPLKYLYNKHNFHFDLINEIIVGKKYIAVVLKNGNIGITANLSNINKIDFDSNHCIYLNDYKHRLLLNAYFNAYLNYDINKYEKNNMFDLVDFSIYNDPVMIGYSEPIIKYIQKNNLDFHIFDFEENGKDVTDNRLQKSYLKSCDVIILTATTIYNNTFLNIVKQTNNNCDIFIVGPSSIMTNDMFLYRNIKGIFGTIFLNNDNRVLDVVAKGEGTSFFKQFGTKIALYNNGRL